MNVGIMGTHGVGKTTTINHLIELPSVKLYEGVGDDHGNPITDPIWARQLWRLGKYISDYTEATFSDVASEQIRLIDRCPYDWAAYTHAFHEQNKIDEDHFGLLDTAYETLRKNGILPNHVIFIHPPYEWVVDRIKERWNEEKKKWNEGDFEYLLILRHQYERIASNTPDTNFLIVTATKLNERLTQIEEWLHQINPAWSYNQKIYKLENGR